MCLPNTVLHHPSYYPEPSATAGTEELENRNPRRLAYLAILVVGVAFTLPRSVIASPQGKGVLALDVSVDRSRPEGPLDLLYAEQAADHESPLLFYQRSKEEGKSWTDPVRVDEGTSPPFSPHRGLDPQVASHGDQVIAVWTTPGTDQWGSGPMATARSEDGGVTWTAGPNPADDGLTTGHGFIDLVADLDGIFHLVWLDSRDQHQGLRYARSEDGGQTWSKNLTIQQGTCECCRNTLTVGENGEIAVLYRDHNPRDMKIASSSDHGKTWSAGKTAGIFDWEFEGCPHAGGGLAISIASTVQSGPSDRHAVVWTGATDRIGVYAVSQVAGEPTESITQLGLPTASYPDLAIWKGNTLAAVWVEHGSEGSPVRCAMKRFDQDSWHDPIVLDLADSTATHPLVVPVPSGFRVFWTESIDGQGRWKSQAILARKSESRNDF